MRLRTPGVIPFCSDVVLPALRKPLEARPLGEPIRIGMAHHIVQSLPKKSGRGLVIHARKARPC